MKVIPEQKAGNSLVREQKAWASRVKMDWQAGATIDARRAIAERRDPCHQSVVLDLAFEEYCQRIERGEVVNTTDFLRRFPEVAHSLEKMILVDNWLNQKKDKTIWPEIDSIVAGFHLREELGRGAFGRVFLAEEIGLKNRQVVVKFSHQGRHEAESLAQLRHPGIVPLYSVQHSETHSSTIICMPFLSRSTLLDVIDVVHSSPGPCLNGESIRQAARSLNLHEPEGTSAKPASASSSDFYESVFALALELAQALASAHQAGLLHRDVKPANILVDIEGHTYLIDFHLSVEEGSFAPAAGSLPYLSPDVLRDFVNEISQSPLAAGQRADLFALGVTLHELAFGFHPFGPVPLGSEPRHLAKWLLERQQQGPHFPLAAPQDMRTILGRLMEGDPNKQFSNAEELVAALQAMKGFRTRFVKWLRHYQTYLITLVSTIALIYASYWLMKPSFLDLHLNSARDALVSGDWTEALRETNTILLAQHNNEARQLRVQALMALERFSDAAVDIEYLLSQPNHKSSGWELQTAAYCHLRSSNFDVARPYLLEALSLDPNSAALHNNLGFLCLRENQFPEAEQQLALALKYDPRSAESYFNRSVLGFRLAIEHQRVVEKSVQNDIERAIQFAKVDHPELHLMAARIAVAMNPPQVEAALASLNQAVKLGINRRRLIYDVYLKPARESEEFLVLVASSDENGTNSRFPALIPPQSN